MAQKTIRILGIESSCDETAAAIVEDGRRIVSDFISTQIDIHKQYGGVFPEVASRQHVLAVYPVIDEVMSRAHMTYSDIDAIAVTRGPGLAGSLVVGMNAAKGLAMATGLPLIGINHLEGHIYSSWVYSDHDGTIPPEKLERIVERFYRLDAARGSETGGSGLGLAIARQLAEAQGGAITAASENGTVRFTVTLPCQPLKVE